MMRTLKTAVVVQHKKAAAVRGFRENCLNHIYRPMLVYNNNDQSKDR